MIYIYYFQHTIFGFYELGLTLLKLGIAILFSYFMLTFEIPALDWSPDCHYTPSHRSPRMLYFPGFSLTWNHELPPIWTMFYPLFGRSYFSAREMSFINENYTLLQQTLENARQRNYLENDFELEALVQNNQIEIDVQDENNDEEVHEEQENQNNTGTNSNEGNSDQNLVQNEC